MGVGLGFERVQNQALFTRTIWVLHAVVKNIEYYWWKILWRFHISDLSKKARAFAWELVISGVDDEPTKIIVIINTEIQSASSEWHWTLRFRNMWVYFSILADSSTRRFGRVVPLASDDSIYSAQSA